LSVSVNHHTSLKVQDTEPNYVGCEVRTLPLLIFLINL
jgi:hypothetical protein